MNNECSSEVRMTWDSKTAQQHTALKLIYSPQSLYFCLDYPTTHCAIHEEQEAISIILNYFSYNNVSFLSLTIYKRG